MWLQQQGGSNDINTHQIFEESKLLSIDVNIDAEYENMMMCLLSLLSILW
jgi:hypothetical protein